MDYLVTYLFDLGVKVVEGLLTMCLDNFSAAFELRFVGLEGVQIEFFRICFQKIMQLSGNSFHKERHKDKLHQSGIRAGVET